jgi:hypothetical protein|tara:strand:- start:2648 stop:3061 length:414 start_codon:yes stop_codon:yes gene_type:complete
MGRKPKKLEDRKTDVYNFRCSDHELMEDIWDIAKREAITFGDLCVQALEEYNERHGAGNSQTLLESYGAGGVKSDGQLEQELARTLIARYAQGSGALDFSEIIRWLRIQEDIQAPKLKPMADRVAKKIGELGIKVWS